ncbi:SDR family NAD(P)-dependent oxidoreductase [Leifsonia sp. F6_8S_P_1B]|uniref:SDR family NAD(P)-dependent oxidoreductase n=1 Tax=Leifsonia williamsii TaxID=3035919 RepID=A0ABT8KAP2_9MICO|nr:SDR family NAD(P)-dependent oxidoreductase [Leifsonia williamsii]MDN4614122.1 SDR family NAD(P)-dependent oxidoreductase [Leifsonia williamsii]
MILVTGASTGLGLATAEALAAAGHRVVLHARRADRLTTPAVAERMHAVVLGDLSDADATVDVARQANALGRFDAVIHNAGVIDGPVTAVNVIAPYLLMASLTPPDRSIVLSSGMHRSGSPDLDRAFRGRGDYSTSKLLVTTLAFALARRSRILSHAVDPGWVPTRMGGRGAPDSLEEGHRTQEWLATADPAGIEPRTGGYWYHRQPRAPHPATVDPAFQDALVERLSRVTGLELPSG